MGANDPVLTRRGFVRRVGLTATALAALPLLAACTGSAPAMPVPEPPPSAEPAPTAVRFAPVPVIAAGTQLALLVASGASAAADAQFGVLANEWGRQHGIAVAIETVAPAIARARLAAPGGTAGLDIAQCRDNWAWIAGERFADVSAEAEALAAAFGGYYAAPAMQAYVVGAAGATGAAGTWRAIPFMVAPSALIYRADWVKAVGATAFPTTIDELLKVGKALKGAGHPFGASAGRSVEDPRALWHAILWAFGGRVTEADGTTIAIGGPETVAALEWAKQFWAEACLPEGLAWDDNGNNVAYGNAQIAATQNGPNLYLKIRRDAPELAAQSALAPFPAGPGGQAAPVTTYAHAVLAEAPHGDAARAFLTWLGQRAQTDRYLMAGGGALVAALRGYEDSPVWSGDPKLRAFLAAAGSGRWVGWPAAPAATTSAADAGFVVVDMFARVLAGKTAQASIGEAEATLRGILAS